MMTFAQFQAAVMEKAFPDGEPENLVKHHRTDLIAGIIHVQTYCDFYKRNVTNVHPYCSTFFWCGASVIDAPRGAIKRVYTLPSGADCCPVDYDFVSSFDVFRAWLFATRPKWTKPENAGLPEIPALGMTYAEDVTDKGHRYAYGYYTIREGKIYLAHRIESTERIIVEFDGVKRNWKDDDLIPVSGWHDTDDDDGVELISLLAKYVQSQDKLLYTEDPKGGSFLMQQFASDFAELIARTKRESRGRPFSSFNPRPILSINAPCGQEECTVPETTDETAVFAIVGDTQNDPGNGNADAVATLIDSWGPSYIVTVGDNWYDSAKTLEDLDSNIGTLYRKWLYPYRGTQGAQVSAQQNFYAAVGNHDRDPSPRLDIERDYFNLPPTGADKSQPCRGYYDFVRGPVHFFLLDGGYNNHNVNAQEDGVAPDSSQAQWFMAKAKASTAKWKIAIIHQPPHCSYSFSGTDNNVNGYPQLRWDFKTAGMDVVISGHLHAYERLSVEGVPYIVNGLGGASIHAPTEPYSEYSLVRYATMHGAQRVTVNCASLKLEFINKDGALIDTLELTK